MSDEIQESFQPRLYILSSNSKAIILESETEECKIVMYNNLTNFYENNTEEQFVISSSNEIFKISKDSNLLTSFIYNNNESIQYIDVNRTKQVLFDKVNNDISSDRGLGFVNDNFTVQLQPNDYFRVNRGTDVMMHSGYYPSGSEYRLGIGTNAPTQALHVKGNILSSGTIVASNLTVLGDTVTLNTVTSNTEQVVISNDGSGPALKVSQTGMNNIAEFYDDGQITLIIEDGGYVGIGTTNPVEMLDVNGNAKVSGSVSTNSVYISGGDLYFEGSPVQLPYIIQSKWTYDNVTESLYWNLGNVGIGTTYPSDKLHIDGGLFVNGDINLNNSNINVGTGNVTASTFTGTATRVSNSINIGSYLTGDNFDGSSASTISVDGTITPDSDKVVIRDSSSNIFVGGIGIGTGIVSKPLHVEGESYLNGVINTNSNSILVGTGTVYAQRFEGTASNIEYPLVIGTYLTGNNYDGSSVSTISVDGTSTPDANKVVVRDGSSNIYIGGVGIGTTSISYSLDVVGDINFTGNLYKDGSSFKNTPWTSNVNSTIYYNLGNVGIGTTEPINKLHVNGKSYLNGEVITNNNNINVGTGTVTASTFSGTATRVSNSLSTGDSYLVGSSFDGSSAVSWTINADSANGNSTIVARDGSGNFSAGTITANLTGNVSGNATSADKVNNSLSTGDSYLVGSSFDGSSSTSWTINADSANGNGTIVARDGSGNFSANNIIANGTLTASNLVVLGDTVQLDTITSNTEQMVITNDGTGPALQVTQTGAQPIADFYDDGNVLALRIADGGLVGIGTDNPSQLLHVEGQSYLNGTVDTNNNNINAGSGTITANTFSGTATQVSNTLTVGSYLTGDNFDGSAASTIAVDATDANTASKVVARDASGNFSAGTITASLSGNATTSTTATQVGNTLTIGSYLTGDNFNGSAASTISVDGTTTSTANKVVVRDGNANLFAGGIGISTASLSSYKLYVVGDINYTGNLYQNGTIFTGGGSSIWSTSGNIIYYTAGNVGIGTDTPLQLIHIEGQSYLNGTVTTNNNNINAGSGTVTASTFSGTATQVSNTLTIGSYLTGDNFDGSSASTIAVDATDANTASKVVARDASGNFSAGTITATLSGTATQVSSTLTRGTYLTGSDFDGSSATTWAVDSTSTNTASKVVARDGNGDFSAGTITATLSGTATQVSSTLTRVTYLTGSDFDGSSATTWAVDATSTNTASKVVARDGNGDFSAGTITATLSGTATQVSSTLTRVTYLTGSDFDGSSATTWAVDATSTNTASKVVARDGNGDFSAGTITATLSGTATQVSSTLTRGTYLTGSDFDGSSATTWAVDATSTNTASKVVARDGNGDFSAGTITATLSGTATQVSSTLTRGTYLTGSDFDGSSATTWAVDATSTNTASKVVARDGNGDFS